MQREVNFTVLGEFIGEMKRLGIEKIAFCQTDEKRAVQEKPELLSVQKVVKLELLAYRGSVLYKCALAGIDLQEHFDALVAEGFDVNRTSRNIT